MSFLVAPHVGAWIETLARQQSRNQEMSHPMWVRGLKQKMRFDIAQAAAVAPHVGAWIETKLMKRKYLTASSHPMWVRGLKHNIRAAFALDKLVAPHVGAWIETNEAQRMSNELFVAPHVGAWIETCALNLFCSCIMSHPMWVRGLKHAK